MSVSVKTLSHLRNNMISSINNILYLLKKIILKRIQTKHLTATDQPRVLYKELLLTSRREGSGVRAHNCINHSTRPADVDFLQQSALVCFFS